MTYATTAILALLLHAAIVSGEPVRYDCGRCNACSYDPATGITTATVRLNCGEPLRADETLPVALLSGAADAWTALDLQERQVTREVNPLAQTSGKLVAVQFASVGGHLLITHAIDRRYGRRWGKRALWGIAGLKAILAGIHLSQGR